MDKERRAEIQNTFKVAKALADKEGVAITRVAIECGINPTIMTHWKNGRSMPKADKLKAIAKRFNVPMEDLLA